MPDIYINTDRTIDRSIVAGINQPQREVQIGALVAGSSYDTNLYFVKNDGTYDALSGDAGASVQVAISTLGKPQSGTFTLTDGTDTTSPLSYGATAQEIEDALNALNGDTGLELGTTSKVDVEKVNNTQYALTFRTFGAMTAIEGSTVSLYPESGVDGSVAVSGSSTQYAQQIIEIARQPAAYQATWSAITNGFNATIALNTTRLLQSLLIDKGEAFYIEVKLNGEVVAREVVGVEYSVMPASAFSEAAISSLLDLFAADPTSNDSFDGAAWNSALTSLIQSSNYTWTGDHIFDNTVNIADRLDFNNPVYSTSLQLSDLSASNVLYLPENSGTLVARSSSPASASSPGTTREIAWDASYIYICTATDTWKRVAVSTW